MNVGAHRGQRRALDFSEMGISVTGYCQSLTWVMRSELGFSAVAVCATNH